MAIDITTATFFELNVYADDTKAVALAGPITHVNNVTRDRKLTDHETYSIDAILVDPATAGITKGSYAEVLAGYGTQRLWWNGILQTLTANEGKPDQYTLAALSASIILEDFTSGAHLEMRWPKYKNIGDVINGVNKPGTPAQPGELGLLTGTGWTAVWIDPKGSTWPGVGDGWGVTYDTVWNSLINLAAHYNFYIRIRPGSTTTNGVLECGPLNDSPSKAEIWGGQPLAQRQGHDNNQFSFLYNASLAQQNSDAIIADAQFNDDMSGVFNIMWPIGHGTGKTTITLAPLVGNAPPDSSWTPYQAWAQGRLFYEKNNLKATYSGNTYQLIATQNQEGGWRYGVADLTSIAQYGPKEMQLDLKNITDSGWLLSAGLGHLEYLSNPVPQWTFDVLHPLTSQNGLPNIPMPGEQVTIHYSGDVQGTAIDTNPSSRTYGQYIPTGRYTYLSFPGSYGTNQAAIDKLTRLIEITDTWDDQSGFTATYTMGRGKWKSKYISDHLSRQIINKNHDPYVKEHFVRHPFQHISWLFSQNPDAGITDDGTAQWLNPGAITVSDVWDATFFPEHSAVSFTAAIADDTQCLDFWFCKPMDGTLREENTGGTTYGVFRLAMAKSGKTTGIYLYDGTTWTKKSATPHKKKFPLHFGTWRVIFPFSHNTFEAHIAKVVAGNDSQPFVASVWRDEKKLLSTYGAIGFHLNGGSNRCTIGDIHAKEHTKHHKPPHGGDGNGGKTEILF